MSVSSPDLLEAEFPPQLVIPSGIPSRFFAPASTVVLHRMRDAGERAIYMGDIQQWFGGEPLPLWVGTESIESTKEASMLKQIKTRLKVLVLSCFLAGTISLISIVFSGLDYMGIVHSASYLFWLSVASGSFGVAGSSVIYARRLLRERKWAGTKP